MCVIFMIMYLCLRIITQKVLYEIVRKSLLKLCIYEVNVLLVIWLHSDAWGNILDGEMTLGEIQGM